MAKTKSTMSYEPLQRLLQRINQVELEDLLATLYRTQDLVVVERKEQLALFTDADGTPGPEVVRRTSIDPAHAAAWEPPRVETEQISIWVNLRTSSAAYFIHLEGQPGAIRATTVHGGYGEWTPFG